MRQRYTGTVITLDAPGIDDSFSDAERKRTLPPFQPRCRTHIDAGIHEAGLSRRDDIFFRDVGQTGEVTTPMEGVWRSQLGDKVGARLTDERIQAEPLRWTKAGRTASQ
jgi:hypothetical protein